jgi:hypothetical protein
MESTLGVLVRICTTLACLALTAVIAAMLIGLDIDLYARFMLGSLALFFLACAIASAIWPERLVKMFGRYQQRDRALDVGAGIYGAAAVCFGLLMLVFPDRPHLALLLSLPLAVIGLVVHVRWLIRVLHKKE